MLVVDSGGVLLHPHQGANLNSGCQYKDAVGAIVYIFESRMSAAEKKTLFLVKSFQKVLPYVVSYNSENQYD